VINLIYAKVKFVRNLKDYAFQHKISNSQQSDILKLCTNAVNDSGLKCVELKDTSDNVINSLLVQGLLENDFVLNPQNKGFASSDNTTIQINGKNHIEIFSQDIDLYKAYKKTKDIDKILCNKLSFAYNDKYGFLTPDIKNIGSGISIECKIMLPALNQINAIKTLPKISEKLLFNIECIDYESGMCLIYTGANLGYTEKQICELTHSYINKIMELEIKASKALLNDDVDEILDCNARAKAVLKNCIKIESREVYALIGNILIAINSEQEKEVDLIQINKVLQQCNYFNENPKELAKNIQKILK